MKKIQLNYVLTGIAAIGLIISFLLIQKYFGGGDGAAKALCDALSESGSCDKVSESSFSAIRNIPFFGDVPIALFGFAFYGFIGFLFVWAERYKEKEADYTRLAFYLLILGLIVDISLFLVSSLVIEAICGLCVATYLVTLALLGITYIKFKAIQEKTITKVFPVITKDILNFAIALLIFLLIGQVFGKISGPSLTAGEHSGASQIARSLAEYEAAPVIPIDITGSSFQGDANAPITIVKFADFNCGHCMHTSHILKGILRDYEGIVKVVYKNFPLDGNCNRLVQRSSPQASSCVAASAAICADKQHKFPVIYDGLYADNELGVMHTPATVLKLAESNGLDMNSFRSCLASPAVRQQIAKEVDDAEKMDIRSTPSLFINNKAIRSGTPDEKFLRELINSLIKKV
ncbi:vitamin K epoxide reductase family protein [Leptospira broomii serovar Hurstbridge str. 5399]|uniref:Vitamin K epoxide reductase family protein n=1 Tax=Leptospira broomii serovar Hurstbridge str. 5399 TaxID=1049789 RepID=T0F9D8_9LEPT|nr:thioredoxin domain-containing protein [Leptospira broomii]EQA44516.1 vitamin K epoxide reductase family protein [Leptospira broomii serovar Hurstbridge str. 5399]